MGHDNRDLLPMGSTFDIARRGYDRGQVDEHLDRLDADLRILAADRDAAVAHASELAKQVENQRAQLVNNEHDLAKLSLAPTSMEGLSDRMQRMLRLAQDEAAEIKARSEAEAAELMTRTETDGVALRDRYQRLISELEMRRATMEDEHRGLVGRAEAEATRLVTDARAEATRLETESAARRTQVDEDFDIAMSARRGDAMRVLAEQEAASKLEAERRVQEATHEAGRRIAEATETAQRRIAEAKSQVDHLRSVRSRVAAQLRQVRGVLADATAALEPLADEEDPAGVAAAGASAQLADHPTASDHRPGTASGTPPSGTPAADETTVLTPPASSTAATSSSSSSPAAPAAPAPSGSNAETQVFDTRTQETQVIDVRAGTPADTTVRTPAADEATPTLRTPAPSKPEADTADTDQEPDADTERPADAQQRPTKPTAQDERKDTGTDKRTRGRAVAANRR